MGEITIILNGEQRTVPGGLSVAGLLDNLQIKRNTAIVELNRAILKKDDFEATNVNDGDALEIVRFVGGG